MSLSVKTYVRAIKLSKTYMMKITHQNMTIIVIHKWYTHLRIDAAHHRNRIIGDEEVGDVSGIR